MKTVKYTFLTPMHGSIDCSDVITDEERIELSPYQMSTLHSRHEELAEFMENHIEDLSDYVYEGLKELVLKAEFGHFIKYNGKMCLVTYIWTHDKLSDAKLLELKEWIVGQMSDGWGEGLEQNSWMQERVCVPHMYFDEDTLTFEQDEEYSWFVYYYIHPWSANQEWDIYLLETQEVDVDDPKVIATLTLLGYSRGILLFTDKLNLTLFLKANHREDLIEELQGKNWSGIRIYITVEYKEKKDGQIAEFITVADKFATQTFDEILIYSTTTPHEPSCIAEYSTDRTREAMLKLLA